MADAKQDLEEETVTRAATGNEILNDFRKSAGQLLNTIGAVGINGGIGMLYGASLVFCLTSIVLLGVFSQELWPEGLAFASALTAGVLHFVIMFVGLSFVDSYVLYPVKPRPVFVALDVITALILGLTFTSFAASDTRTAWMVAANGLCLVPQLGMLYKAYVIVREILRGRRDRKTGELVGEEEDDY